MGSFFKIVIPVFISFLFYSRVLCQEIKFEHINKENGLPVNSVTALYQDSDGFIWMGSMYGLIKYDGTNFKSFWYDYEDSTTIPGYLVTQIIGNNDGFIYMSIRERGFTCLNPITEKFKTFQKLNTSSLASDNVNDMAFNADGNIWLATSNGLHFFNTTTQQVTRLNISNSYVQTDTLNNYHNYFSAVAVDKFNNLYLLGYKSKLLYYNVNNKTLSQIAYTSKEEESVFLFNSGKLLIDSHNKLWVGTENNGAYLWDIENQKTIKHYLKGSIVSVINEIDGNIWLGSDGDGITIIDSDGKKIKALASNPFDSYSLSSDAVYSIMQSTDKTIWVGVFLKGVDLYNQARHKFGTYNQIGKQNYRLTNKTVLCLSQLNDSILLVGTDGGGINYLNLLTGEIYLLKSKNALLDKIVAKSIAPYNTNSFYLGTYGKGLFYCELNNNLVVNAKPVNRDNSDKYRHIWSLYKDSDSAIWVGYLHTGLSIYNPVNNQFKVLEFYNDHNIHFIDKIDDKIWVSSEQKGMSRCNSKGEVVSWFENDGANPNSLSSNFVLEIFKDSKQRIWIGTNTTGFNRLVDVDKQEFICYNNSIDFPASMVTNIEEDKSGMLWISSNVGIIKFNPNSEKYELFDNKDGLKGKQFNINSSYNYKNEDFYYGGVEGLSYFHPSNVKRFNVVPQLAFTSLIVGNSKVNVGDTVNGRVILAKPLAYTNELLLSHKDGDFTIDFSALHFETSNRNKFKYKLEGFDSDWIECKPGQLSARYTNLSKGSFVFKVMAANPDGMWNPKAKELEITIIPPFYETIGFYWLLFILLTIFVFLIVRWRVHRLQQDKLKLKQLVDLKTQALREKTDMVVEQNIEIKNINNTLKEYNKTRDKVFSIIAHDLRSPLNAIVSFSKLLEFQYQKISDTEKRKYINTIGKTSVKMNELITNLLFWVNNQVGKIEPKPVLNNISDLFKELEEFTKANVLEKQLEVRFNNQASTIYADSEMLVTILRNLLGNSIKFTAKKGQIEVLAESNGETTNIIISDSGVGMTAEQIAVLEKRETLLSTHGTDNETGTGLGLFLCKDFTEKNNGVFQIDSEINVGTTIKLIFPSEIK